MLSIYVLFSTSPFLWVVLKVGAIWVTMHVTMIGQTVQTVTTVKRVVYDYLFEIHTEIYCID